jgi:hypothetical protein
VFAKKKKTDCNSNDDLMCFLFRNILKYSFFIFKKLFLTSKQSKNIKKYFK